MRSVLRPHWASGWLSAVWLVGRSVGRSSLGLLVHPLDGCRFVRVLARGECNRVVHELTHRACAQQCYIERVHDAHRILESRASVHDLLLFHEFTKNIFYQENEELETFFAEDRDPRQLRGIPLFMFSKLSRASICRHPDRKCFESYRTW